MFMGRSSRNAVLAIFLIVIMIGAALALVAVLSSTPPGAPPPPPLRVTLTSEQGVGGEPGMNTSSIWTARITSVTSKESLDSYLAVLKVNGTTVIGPTPVTRGTLGISGALVFDFIETGTYCSPDPCPPPEGPDGLLDVGDYFRISNAVPQTAYTIQMISAATHGVLGEIVVHT